MSAPVLRVRDLSAGYGDTVVLEGVDLDVASGETVALLGPSGSGKTTLLYVVAGLLPWSSGTVELSGAPIEPELAPEDRRVSMVFQNYALWPHLDALETVMYPALRRGLDRAAAEVEARRLLQLVGIGDLAGRLPDQLSGGQQQRVGVARALAARPDLFLLDEPTAHLDAAVRQALQAELVDPAVRGDSAVLYTTHDAGEALAVADRVAVMRQGTVVQVGSPSEVYAQPGNWWVAALTGAASVVTLLVDGGGVVTAGGAAVGRVAGLESERGELSCIVRPEWAHLGGALTATIVARRFEGPHTDFTLHTEVGRLIVREAGEPVLHVGDDVTWSITRAWPIAD